MPIFKEAALCGEYSQNFSNLSDHYISQDDILFKDLVFNYVCASLCMSIPMNKVPKKACSTLISAAGVRDSCVDADLRLLCVDDPQN